MDTLAPFSPSWSVYISYWVKMGHLSPPFSPLLCYSIQVRLGKTYSAYIKTEYSSTKYRGLVASLIGVGHVGELPPGRPPDNYQLLRVEAVEEDAARLSGAAISC